MTKTITREPPAAKPLGERERYQWFREHGWGEEDAQWHAKADAPLQPTKAWRAAYRAEQEARELAEERGDVKADEPKRPERRQRTDALNNERRMREALLRDDKLKANGWTGSGVRKLARQANMAHRTARDVLDRMVDDGQIERDKRIGKRGNRHGFRIILEHPCWSEPETAHLLEQSPLSEQVRGRNRTLLSTGQEEAASLPASCNQGMTTLRPSSVQVRDSHPLMAFKQTDRECAVLPSEQGQREEDVILNAERPRAVKGSTDHSPVANDRGVKTVTYDGKTYKVLKPAETLAEARDNSGLTWKDTPWLKD